MMYILNRYHAHRIMQTIVDVGARHLQRRLRYDIRRYIDSRLPPRFALALSGCFVSTPGWVPILPKLSLDPPITSDSSQLHLNDFISFSFLNQQRKLALPVVWNDSSWPRLWQFNLHYFDWAREWLDHALISGNWPSDAALLEPLLDQWIQANPPGHGDGWHSYTLSLRIRNWIWLFSCCPKLITPFRLRSLWHQLCWLQAHPEHWLGGNHWLENLIALSLGGLQFAGPDAQLIHHLAMRKLKQELSSQVLADGGHEERSASYHVLMLDRLVELACSLSVINGHCPSWLVGSIEVMTTWAIAVRLEDGSAPRFNDSAVDAAPPLDEVIAFAEGYLHQRSACTGLRRTLLGLSSIDSKPSQTNSIPCLTKPAVVTDLPVTGWTLLRPGHGWELAFKCGVPCPPHLAAHAHSDLLSFDLWHHGKPVIAEVGTSIYGSGPIREFERSSAAHNTLQLGSGLGDSVTWIEPVDVWAGFRAGRKAKPHSRSYGLQGSWLWVAGSHNGFCSINAQHYRWLGLCISSNLQPVLVVLDAITASQSVHWRGWFHFGPGLTTSLLEVGLQWYFWSVPAPSHQQTDDGYIATGFGQYQDRSVLRRAGLMSAGKHLIISVLAPQTVQLECSPTASEEGSLLVTDLGRIHWCFPHNLDQQSLHSIPQVLIEA
jgi:hypothetical protein